MLKILFFLTALPAVVLKTCSTSAVPELSPAEYISWVEDAENGLHQEKTIGALRFSMQYKPADYVVLQDVKRTNFSSPEWDSLTKEVSDMQYYTLQIGTADGKDITRFNLGNDQEYYARQEYLSAGMQKDIQLVDGTDTLNCLMYHYERTYGISPDAKVVLAFDNKAPKTALQNKTLILNDNHFGTGIIMLSIDAGSLRSIPQLTLN
ncbi:MAG: hypothetical protein MUC87_22250 [Bacteroidia bacterium]|jgi:hypothetical protein|nr:hypothetical protein [Bacteroidia bacterium]